ncbi:MAG: hypothetical protein MPN21_01945 [Thermoanaerobaculia bacterium]|nr:hypothetical protein [Thermoanaerobaculia bacterium]
MHGTFLAASMVSLALISLAVPSLADEPADRLEDAKASLVQLAAWFDALSPEEQADVAKELRRWLTETYGSEVPFPFALPGEEETGSRQTEPTHAVVSDDAPDEMAASSRSSEASGNARTPAASATPPPIAETRPTGPASLDPNRPSTEALPRTPSPPGRCTTLVPFDTDGDGTLTGRDRHWRHLYLWFDADGDHQVAASEMVSPFEHKIREIDLDLRFFVVGKGKKASRGEIETDEFLLFDTDTDGFGATVFPSGDDAALAVDADALRRDAQGLEIRDEAGAGIMGTQPFVAGWTIIDRESRETQVDCPG